MIPENYVNADPEFLIFVSVNSTALLMCIEKWNEDGTITVRSREKDGWTGTKTIKQENVLPLYHVDYTFGAGHMAHCVCDILHHLYPKAKCFVMFFENSDIRKFG